MATAFPKEALRAIFVTLSGLTSDRVVWRGEPKGWAGPTDAGLTGFLVLEVIARRRVGIDQEVRTYNSDDSTTITYSGNRVLTVQARAESYEKEDEGVDLLELVRLGLGQSDTRALLNAAGVSLATADDVRNLGSGPDNSADNRDVFFATLDFTLNQNVSRSVTTTSETYIAEVEVTGDPDGDLARAGVDDIGPIPPVS